MGESPTPGSIFMKILVCGGRDYDDQDWAFQVLDMIHEENPITCVVHGDATGADSFGQTWARATDGVVEKPYPAKWKLYPKHAAGPIRNALMLKENPDIELVVVFPGKTGTCDMRDKAERAGKNILLAI